MSYHSYKATASPPAEPLHRHQTSLEGVLDFSELEELDGDERQHATDKLHRIADFFESEERNASTRRPYSRANLIRYMFTYSLTPAAKDNFLRAFFTSISSPLNGPDPDFDTIRSAFFEFAEYLFDNFFLPIRAAGNKTPDPSPLIHSAVKSAQSSSSQHGFIGTPARIADLRVKCLTRDRYRCVISRAFDSNEADRLMTKYGPDARDIDGERVLNVTPQKLEVAHILPHALAKLRKENGELDEAKQAALSILNMFDTGVSHLVQGVEVDQPRNAISLTSTNHDWFGRFQVCFEETDEPHRYIVQGFRNVPLISNPPLPITRDLFLMEDKSIDPPSPRLLKIHWAIAHILHLSAAGEYIDKILRDVEECGVRADGSTELGQFVNLRLAGWLSSSV